MKSFNNDIFATRGTRCLDFILVCFHQPPSAPSIFCFLTDLAWLTIYRGRCRGSVKTQVGLSALWRRNFAHNDCPQYSILNKNTQHGLIEDHTRLIILGKMSSQKSLGILLHHLNFLPLSQYGREKSRVKTAELVAWNLNRPRWIYDVWISRFYNT